MRSKRAQVTIFIIIALVIIGGVLIFFLIKDSNNKNYNLENIDLFEQEVSSCLKELSEESIYFICMQGGYLFPSDYESYKFLRIPHYFKDNEKVNPSLEIFEKSISEYIELNAQRCLINQSFRNYTINSKNPVVNTKIESDKTIIEIEYPIYISSEDQTDEIKEFEFEFEMNIKDNYELIESILNEQAKNREYVPIGFISSLASKNDFNFETINLQENIVMYAFFFNNTNQEIPLDYNYVIKYNWVDE